MKALAFAAVALCCALSAQAETCSIDEPGVTRLRSCELLLRELQPCLPEEPPHAPQSLQDALHLARDWCSQPEGVASCVARMRTRLATCANTNVSVPFMILAHLAEDLLSAGCAQGGRRLAVALHGVSLLRRLRAQIAPLRNCLYKVAAVFTIADDADVDLTSESYMSYREIPMLKRCLGHLPPGELRDTAEWAIDEATSSFRCLDPTSGALVPCSGLDLSLVAAGDVCQLRPEPLYDLLEVEAVNCFQFAFVQQVHGDDLTWLEEDFRRMCQIHRVSLDCLLEKAGLAEACLGPGEQEQFQLFMASLDDVIQLGCLEDGRRVARIMHEVYRLRASPDSGLHSCFDGVLARRHDAGGSKNMRFFREVAAFEECVVGGMGGEEVVAQEAKVIFDNILGKMRCVRPGGGAPVLCHTLAVQ